MQALARLAKGRRQFRAAALRKEANRMTSTKQRYRHEIEEVIANAKAVGSRESLTTADGAEIYAYPIPGSRIAWGVNAAQTGWNICAASVAPMAQTKRKVEMTTMTTKELQAQYEQVLAT